MTKNNKTTNEKEVQPVLSELTP